MWSKIFKYQLEMGHNDEAYNAMVSNPDPSRLAMPSCIYNTFDYLNTSIPLQVSVSAGQFNEYSVQYYFTLVEFTKQNSVYCQIYDDEY